MVKEIRVLFSDKDFYTLKKAKKEIIPTKAEGGWREFILIIARVKENK